MQKDDFSKAYVVEGKLALPYTYFAGRVGSTFLTTIRDQKQIMGVQCNQCEKVFVPPRQTCERCLSDIRDNWVTLENSGEVVNFTVVREHDKHLPRKTPYILGLIRLDGADTPMAHIIEGIDPEKITEGMRVRAVFANESEPSILYIDHFEPISS
ncbi:MAG: Zn-ribbon domain-containing OB-fold protein [Desulfosalsimonadaceae bacterium]